MVIDDSGGVFGQCFSCDERFSLGRLVAHVKGISVHEGMNYVEEKFGVEMRTKIVGRSKLKRYEQAEQKQEESLKRFELPRSKLAPFRSGKETHKYFFERGFNKETVKEAMIGWDRVRKRVTIPIFHLDGTLCGFSGRAVLEQKKNGRPNPAYIKLYKNEPKYYIYDNFPIGEVLYGCHFFEKTDDDTAIIVEGLFDMLWLRQQGFKNVVSIIVAKMSMDRRTGISTQAQILHELGVKRVVFMHDNDDPGLVGKSVAYDILKQDFICYDTEYPEGWKDPLGDAEHPPMTPEQIQTMLDNKKVFGKRRLNRL